MAVADAEATEATLTEDVEATKAEEEGQARDATDTPATPIAVDSDPKDWLPDPFILVHIFPLFLINTLIMAPMGICLDLDFEVSYFG